LTIPWNLELGISWVVGFARVSVQGGLMLIEISNVLSNNPLRGDYRVLVLKSPQIAPKVQPGQFIHVRVPGLNEAVLRRPFSVFRSDASTLSVLYKCIGKGTRTMAHLRPGDDVSILGPLGKGFPPIRPDIATILIAGGYGMAALYLSAQRAPVQGVVFVGGAGADDILCVNDFTKIGWQVRAATEDGSLGEKGLVTTAVDKWLRQNRDLRPLDFFACGPMGMLKAVSDRAQAGGWTAWLSLDRHMGCGMGACLACVQKVKIPATVPSDPLNPKSAVEWKWGRVCTEGPVFECRDIVWDET